MPAPIIDPHAYLASKIAHNPNGCWDWQGSLANGGYGTAWRDCKPLKAHRFSYQLHLGPIPDGMDVLHRCDRPCCVNPAHLFLGTQADNNQDRHRKGRYRPESWKGEAFLASRARGERHSSQTRPEALRRGDEHPHARLTEAQIPDIRRRILAGERHSEIARSCSVAQSAIWHIAHGKTWKHVP